MISIRAAKLDEWKIFQKLCEELTKDNSQYDDDVLLDWTKSDKGKKFFIDFLKDKKNCVFIVFDDSRPVGYIACAPKEIIYRKSKFLEIDNMEVSPQYRSKGIGSQLIEKVLEWAKANGFQKMYVNSYVRNKRAIDFYKRNGFAEIDISLEKRI